MKKYILFSLLILSNVSALFAMKHDHDDGGQGGREDKGSKRARTEEQPQEGTVAPANSILAQLAAARASRIARDPEREAQMEREHQGQMRELEEQRKRQEIAAQYGQRIAEIEQQIAEFAGQPVTCSSELFAALTASLNEFFRNYCTHYNGVGQYLHCSLKEVIQTFTGLLFRLMDAFFNVEVVDPTQVVLLQSLMSALTENFGVFLSEDFISDQFGEGEVLPSFVFIQHRTLFDCYILLRSLLISIESRTNNLQEILVELYQIKLPSKEEIGNFIIKEEIIEKIRGLIAQIVGAISQQQEQIIVVVHGLHQQLITQIKRIANYFGVPVDLHVEMDTDNDASLACAQQQQQQEEQFRHDEEVARRLHQEEKHGSVPAPMPMPAAPVDPELAAAIAASLQDQATAPTTTSGQSIRQWFGSWFK